jgi:1-phosphofructokinase
MIVTVTANTCIDYTMFVDDWMQGKTLRANRVVQGIAGKPTDASYVLGEMGIQSLALGFKAGTTGEAVEQFLVRKGVATDFITVGGQSRLNVVIHCEKGGWETTVTTSTLSVSDEDIIALQDRFLGVLPEASCVVLGGTLPQGVSPEFYTTLIRHARRRDVPVIFDASEPYLSAGLEGGPTYIKPNRDELSQCLDRPITSCSEAYWAGRELTERYGVSAVITLGAEGALALLSERSYFIPGLDVPVASTAGAGDAVLAGLAAAIDSASPLEDGLRLGFAAAAAVVMMPGTAECRMEDIQRLLPRIELQDYLPGRH